jgi:hypothetical protein
MTPEAPDGNPPIVLGRRTCTERLDVIGGRQRMLCLEGSGSIADDRRSECGPAMDRDSLGSWPSILLLRLAYPRFPDRAGDTAGMCKDGLFAGENPGAPHTTVLATSRAFQLAPIEP